MKKVLSVFLAMGLLPALWAQSQEDAPQDTSWKKQYRASAPRINDLVHTKLDVKFDYSKSYMNGQAWIPLVPHCYPTDSLTLDAKGMEMHKIAIVKGASSQP